MALSKTTLILIDPGSKSEYTHSKLTVILIGLQSNMNIKKRAETVRYEENPFIEGMIVPVKSRNVQLSRLGRDQNILVNQSTGEIQGTHVTTYRRVDSEEFVKLFTANIALTFELKAAGIKAFSVLVWILQEKGISKDLAPLDKFVLDDFLEAHKDKKLALSQATFARGLSELETAKIIAKHLRPGWYFINPNFIFNGDRIAFTTVIERKKREQVDDKTIDMFADQIEG